MHADAPLYRLRSAAMTWRLRNAEGGGGVVTYSDGRYPVHLIDVVPMADGSRITIRPTLPQDVDLLRTFFRTLSAESRYCRFMIG